MRAVADHAHAGDIRSAASDAVALSVIHLERCEEAVAKGWLARADDWAARLKDAVTTGLVLWMKSRVAASEGDPQQALSLAEQAYDCTRNQGVLKAEALSLAYRGFYRLSLGDTRGGFADQDHAAIIALSNNVDPITGGTLYCNILWACRMFGDWARADQWTLSYQKFCTDSRMELSGACQLHRSEVLGIKGSLPEALSRVQDALDRLSNDAPWSRGDAHRVLGDIHAAIGDDEAALEAYDKAYALGWCPEPGRAMLLLERGEAEAAYASLERSLIGQGWWTLQRRGILLAHLALAAARTGRHERAAALIAGLTGDTQRWPMPSIRALTNEARAVLALARSHHDEAIRFLHLSRQLWSSVDGRVHAARLRLQIATLLLDAGDMRGAGVETQAAQMAADGLQSGKLQRAGKELQHRITRVQPDPAAR
jgi:tetratricopeptide (TPR) repeat protein